MTAVVFSYFFIFRKRNNKTEDDGKCVNYDKNKCVSCKLGFKLVDGKCEDNYSFKAEYYADQENKTIFLINKLYEDKIIDLIIDGNPINKSITNYTFKSKGFHTAYVLLDLSKMTSFKEMFSFMRDMTAIHFSSLFNTENITNMDLMFNAIKVTSINVSNFDTRQVTSMSSMFVSMTYLKSIDISNFKTESLILFDVCLKEIII